MGPDPNPSPTKATKGTGSEVTVAEVEEDSGGSGSHRPRAGRRRKRRTRSALQAAETEYQSLMEEEEEEEEECEEDAQECEEVGELRVDPGALTPGEHMDDDNILYVDPLARDGEDDARGDGDADGDGVGKVGWEGDRNEDGNGLANGSGPWDAPDRESKLHHQPGMSEILLSGSAAIEPHTSGPCSQSSSSSAGDGRSAPPKGVSSRTRLQRRQREANVDPRVPPELDHVNLISDVELSATLESEHSPISTAQPTPSATPTRNTNPDRNPDPTVQQSVLRTTTLQFDRESSDSEPESGASEPEPNSRQYIRSIHSHSSLPLSPTTKCRAPRRTSTRHSSRSHTPSDFSGDERSVPLESVGARGREERRRLQALSRARKEPHPSSGSSSEGELYPAKRPRVVSSAESEGHRAAKRTVVPDLSTDESDPPLRGRKRARRTVVSD